LRAAIFIDGAYFLSFMKKHEIAPKYEDIADYLLKPLRKTVPLDMLRCYFYYCAPWMSLEPTDSEKRRMEEHNAFMSEIGGLDRWSVRLGKLQKRWDGYKEYFEQKRVDVLLSVDMVRHSASGHIQHVVVVAGDSDFIPAIEATKESGATVTLWYGDDNTVHKDLLKLADITHQLNSKKIPKTKMKAVIKPVKTEKKEKTVIRVAVRDKSDFGKQNKSDRKKKNPSGKN